MFRGKFLEYLKKAYDSGDLKFIGKVAQLGNRFAFKQLLSAFYEIQWIVYCKPPFKKSEKVLDCLGRYTHRVVLSNDRIEKFEDGR